MTTARIERGCRRRVLAGLLVAGLVAAAACNEASLTGPPSCGPTDNCSCETDPTQPKCGGFNQTTDSGSGGDAAAIGEDAADGNEPADVFVPPDAPADGGDASD